MADCSRTTARYVLISLFLLAAVTACSASPTAGPTTTYTFPPPTATPSPTDMPIPTATPTPTVTPTPTATPTPLPEYVFLEPTNYQWQTLNNCGPASVAILLGYYDHWITQQEVNEQIPPRPGVCGMVAFFPQYDLMARAYTTSYSGEGIRRLLANQIPVIVGQELEYNSDISHYRVYKGYDQAAREFIVDDPLRRKGPDLRIPYGLFVILSKPGVFVPVYPPEFDPLVQSLLWDWQAREIDCLE